MLSVIEQMFVMSVTRGELSDRYAGKGDLGDRQLQLRLFRSPRTWLCWLVDDQ